MWAKDKIWPGKIGPEKKSDGGADGEEADDTSQVELDWGNAYFYYITNTMKLQAIMEEIQERAAIDAGYVEFPKHTEKTKSLYFDWFILDKKDTEQRHKSLGAEMNQLLFEPSAAQLITKLGKAQPGGAAQEIYVSSLLKKDVKRDVSVVDNLRKALIKKAAEVLAQWGILEANKKWFQ